MMKYEGRETGRGRTEEGKHQERRGRGGCSDRSGIGDARRKLLGFRLITGGIRSFESECMHAQAQ